MSAPSPAPPLPRIRLTAEIAFVFKATGLCMDLQQLFDWTVQIAVKKCNDDVEWSKKLLDLAQDIDQLRRSILAQKLLLEQELEKTGKYTQKTIRD